MGSDSGKDGYLSGQNGAAGVQNLQVGSDADLHRSHPSSIHPLLWGVGYVIHKTDLKRAVVADRIKSGQVRDVRFEIDGIPQTDWRCNTKDPAVWSWTGAEEDDEPEPGDVAYDVALCTVKQCKEDGLSHRETAKYIPFGKSWVGKRWPEIREGKHKNALDTVEEITA